jgi:hypothetical protein
MISVNNNFGKNKAQFKTKTMEKENLKLVKESGKGKLYEANTFLIWL